MERKYEQSFRKIAAGLGRSTSSISREVKRNQGAQARYHPPYADEQAWARRWRGSRMAREKSGLRISHESIYRFIYAQIARTQDDTWRRYLPRGKSKRGWYRRPHQPVQHIKDRVSIEQRPRHIEKRRQKGHGEADLLHPRKSGAAVLVAVERASRFVLLAKQPGKHAAPVAEQLTNWFSAMPSRLRRSLTQDNGTGFFLHHRLNPLGVKTYFCHPHHPWQKGCVENMNGRLRRYIPLGTDPESFSNDALQALAHRLNHTPRKCLGFKTPAEVFLPLLKPLHLKCESTYRPSPV